MENNLFYLKLKKAVWRSALLQNKQRATRQTSFKKRKKEKKNNSFAPGILLLLS